MSGISVLANFESGGYAMRVYFDYKIPQKIGGVELKKGWVSIHNGDGRVVECITANDFQKRYGLPPVRG